MNSYEKWKQIEGEINEVHDRRDKDIEIKLNKCLNYEKEFIYSFKDEDLPSKALQKDKDRKETPIYSGFVTYFPNAIRDVARLSLIANEQHNPNQPLHWDKSKSKNELDSCMRHLIDYASGIEFDDDNVRHLTKCAWRMMGMLERTLTNKLD